MKLDKTLVVGIACGLGCALCVGLYVVQVNDKAETARAEALARYGGEQLEVCVARRAITAGEVVDEGSVESKMWLVDLLPEQAITDRSDVVGKQIGSTVVQGEVISAGHLAVEESRLDIPSGLTAISVPARDVQSVGGTLRSGMRVDVYATGEQGTDRLLENALILDSSASLDQTRGSTSSWLTLAVPEQSVQELVVAAQQLELYFTLPSGNAPKGGKDE